MRVALLSVSVFIAAAAFGSDQEPSKAETIGSIMVAFGDHLDGHPLAGAEDLYKFLHQAVNGSGHAITDREAASQWLDHEIEGLGPPLDDEPSCEELGGEPPLVRVNLRPFLAGGGDPDTLVDAFVASADDERGSAGRMEVVLSLAVSYLECAGRGELSKELEALASELAARGYPPIHHSGAYAEAYRPAYRVVEWETAAVHGWCGKTAAP